MALSDSIIDSLPETIPAKPESTFSDSLIDSLPEASSPRPTAASPLDVPAQFDVPQDPRVDARPDEQRMRDMLSWRVRNETRAPEEQAEILRLSAATGWPADTVAGDLPAARNMVEASKMDVATVVRDHPALASFLGDPETSVLARGDAERLTGLARLIGERTWVPDGGVDSMTGDATGSWVTTKKGAWQNFNREASLQASINELSGSLLAGGQVPDPEAPPQLIDQGDAGLQSVPATRAMTPEERKAAWDEVHLKQAELAELARHGDGMGDAAWYHPAKMLLNVVKFARTMGPTMAKAAAIEAGASAVGTPAAGLAAGSAYWAQDLAPGIYVTLHELQKADGSGPVLTDEEARNYATVVAAPIGATMAGSLGLMGLGGKKWLTSKPVVEAALLRYLPGSVEKLTASKTWGAVVAKTAGNYTAHQAQGALAMGVQSGLTQAAVEVAKGTHGEESSPGAVAAAFEEGAIQGLKDFALIAAWGPVRRAIGEHGKIQASRQSAETLRDIAVETKDSLLAQRDPERFGKLVTEFGPDKTVYATLEKFDEMAQEERVDPRKLASDIIGDSGEAYDKAKAGGSDLAIPLGRYAEKVMLSGLHEKLESDIRWGLEEHTPRQTVEAMKAMAKAITERAAARGPAYEQEVRALRETLLKAATEARGVDAEGKATRLSRGEATAWADLVTKTASSWSLRLDKSLSETMEKMGLPLLHLEGKNILDGSDFGSAPTGHAKHSGWGENTLPSAAKASGGAPLLHLAADSEWFAGSKVVDAEGLPLRLYHGTSADADFSKFRVGKRGVFLTSDPAHASEYARQNDHRGPVMDRYTGKITEKNTAERVIPLFASIKNPHKPTPAEMEAMKMAPNYARHQAAWFEKLRLQGYDGVDLGNGVWVAFRPEQLKSSLGNSGEFNAKSTSILEQGALASPVEARELGDLDPGIQRALLARVRASLGVLPDPAPVVEGRKLEFRPDRPLELEDALESASLAGAVVRDEDGFLTIRNSESKLWMMATPKEDQRMMETSVLGVDGGGAKGSKSYDAAVESERGRGYSTSYYLKAMVEAKARGFGMMSDTKRSPATEAMYARLKDGLGIPYELREDSQGRTRYVLDAETLSGIDIDAKWELLQAQTKAKHGELRQDRRGFIQLRVDPTGKPVLFNIKALAGDKSTLAHETMHFLSWSMHELASAADAPEGIKADYAALLKFAGYKDAAARLAESAYRSEKGGNVSNAYRAREERITHAWEQYLAEGKAPSPELRGVFGRFRGWLADIYGKLSGINDQYRRVYGQDIGLTDEVRGIFDRMLASDNEVERLRAEDHITEANGEVLHLRDLLHMTTEQSAALDALREEKYADARERLDIAVRYAGGKAASSALKNERARMRAEAIRDVDARPEQRAHDLLAEGKMRDPDSGEVIPVPEALRGAKLSEADAAKVLGPKGAAELARRGLTSKDGFAASELAEVLGFDSGDALVRALGFMPERALAVDKEVARRFEAAFGPELHRNAEALKAMGDEAIHSPAAISEALHVRAALARELGRTGEQDGVLPLKLLKKNAARLIDGTRVEDISPRLHLDSERAQKRAAYKLMAKAARAFNGGRVDEAKEFYSQALHEWDAAVLSQLLWGEAKARIKTLASAEAAVKRAAKGAWRQKLGLADIALADASDSIVNALGFSENKPAAKGTIGAALAAIERMGDGSIIKDEFGVLASALWDSAAVERLVEEPVQWGKLTAEEALNAADAVANLKATANGRNKVEVGRNRMTRESFVARLKESTAALPDTNDPANPDALSSWGQVALKAKKLGRSLDSNLIEMEALVERLTQGDRNHPAWQLFVGEYHKARDVELALTKDFVKGFKKLWRAMPAEMKSRMNSVVEGAREALPLRDTGGILNQNSPMTYGELWMVAMNWGNAGNKQRLLDGYRWGEGQVRAVLEKHLTKADWTWVEGVWSSLAGLYPHMEQVHIETTGMRPKQVEALPFTIGTADGHTLALGGGYFPARWDARIPTRNSVGERQAESATDALMVPVGRPARTNTGATKARAEKVSEGIIDLNFRVVPSHVASVIHDIAFRKYVRSANGVILDPAFQGIARGKLGPEYAALFTGWIQAVASGGRSQDSSSMSGVNGMVSWAKGRATLAAVGFSVGIPLADLTNPLLPVMSGDLSAKHLAIVTKRLATNWHELRAFALENSIEMRQRAEHGNSLGIDIERAMEADLPFIKGKAVDRARAWQREVEHAAYWMMERSDAATSTPVWLSKYYELTEKGSSHEDAVRDADALVRKFFPSTDMATKSAWLRDKGLMGHLAFLAGFANKVYGFNRRTIVHAYDTVRDPGSTYASKARALGGAMFILAAQASVLGIPGDFLSGRGPSKDGKKKEDGVMAPLASLVTEPGGMPNWMLSHTLDVAAYQLPFGNWVGGPSGKGGVPGVSLLKKMLSETTAASNGKQRAGGRPPVGPVEFAGFLGASTVLGAAGINQAIKTGSYADNNMSEDLRRGRYRSVASGLVYGDKSSDVVTPLNIGQGR